MTTTRFRTRSRTFFGFRHGKALLTLLHVGPGSVVDIRPMQMHAVRAISELHIIEVQLGSPLVEEDIERFGNFWDE